MIRCDLRIISGSTRLRRVSYEFNSQPSCSFEAEHRLIHFRLLDRFITNHICPRRYVTQKRSDMYQNIWTICHNLCLLGQFVAILI